jgi:hypothetical protein
LEVQHFSRQKKVGYNGHLIKANSIEDLRKLPASELNESAINTRCITDGYVLPQSIAEIFAANKEKRCGFVNRLE